jgi:hypothetical protein
MTHDVYAVSAPWHFALPWMLFSFLIGGGLGFWLGRKGKKP